MRYIKKILLFLLLGLIAFVVVYFEEASYGIGQLKGQLRILNEAKPLEEVLEDPSFPDSLKQRIHYIDTVKQFAIQELGLKESESYTTLYDQKGEQILWNVTASAPYALEAYEWTFPLAGSFSYKGFFEKDKAVSLSESLQAEGYETRIRPVGAWSTLGFFNDPILSNMLERSKGELAELIIHEMTHATLYVKDGVAFNENLATFVGEQGALRFLESNYGKESKELRSYKNSLADYKIYAKYVLKQAESLDVLYQSISDKTAAEKAKLKAAFMSAFVKSLADLPVSEDSHYKKIFRKKMPDNNYFISYRRYREKQSGFADELNEHGEGDIKKYIDWLKVTYESL